jgi:hypothetical protein
LLEEMGEFELAREHYAQLLREFPDADVAPKLQAKLATYTEVPPEVVPIRQIQQERAVPVAGQPESIPCPACNAPMATRRATGGSRAGELFWVCRSYPGCPRIIPVAEAAGGFELERTSAV